MHVPVVVLTLLVVVASGCLESAREFANDVAEAVEEGCQASSSQRGGDVRFTSTDTYDFEVKGPAILTLAAGINRTLPAAASLVVYGPDGREFWSLKAGFGTDSLASEIAMTNPPVGAYEARAEAMPTAEIWFAYAVAGCGTADAE